MKILFIYNTELDGSFGGSQRSIQNIEGLKLFSDVDLYKLNKRNKFWTYFNIFLGYAGNSSFFAQREIFSILKKNHYDFVFFDQAIHGKIVKQVTKKLKIPCLVHYHNNEKEYYYDLYKVQGGVYYPIYRAALYNQELSKKYSFRNIFITNEDAVSVGKTTNDKIVVPITLKDCFPKENFADDNKGYLLFVGAATYANLEAARIIIQHIAPFVNNTIIIAGKNMKTEMNKVFSEIPSNIVLFDYVENLQKLYVNASAFICPLYHGSGMKVKLAEAMMYGKKILATPLSFWGYKKTENCIVCDKPEDFIKQIKCINDKELFFQDNRDTYLNNYSADKNSSYYKQVVKNEKVD